MQAYLLEKFGAPDGLVLHEVEMPRPKTHEVLVRVRASALNFRDLMIASGHYPMPCKAGTVPLSDAAGEVVEIGASVTRFKVGDRVANCFFPRWQAGRFDPGYAAEQYGSDRDGWLVEYKAVSADALVPIPEHLSFEEAATLPCAAVTAWSALGSSAPLMSGETVLIQGTGGVALFALQFAKLRGARVIATTSSAEKAERLKELGADAVINYRVTPEWGRVVRELTNGRGVDKVVEVGGPGTLAQSLRAVAVGGEVAVIGVLDTSATGVDFGQFFMSGAVMRRIMVGSREDFAAMNRAITLHRLRPVIDSVHGFEQASEAWRHFASRAHLGKVVITH